MNTNVPTPLMSSANNNDRPSMENARSTPRLGAQAAPTLSLAPSVTGPAREAKPIVNPRGSRATSHPVQAAPERSWPGGSSPGVVRPTNGRFPGSTPGVSVVSRLMPLHDPRLRQSIPGHPLQRLATGDAGSVGGLPPTFASAPFTLLVLWRDGGRVAPAG